MATNFAFFLKNNYDFEKEVEKQAEKQTIPNNNEPQSLLGTRKIYEFYNAPIVKFWFHTVSYWYCTERFTTMYIDNSVPLHATETNLLMRENKNVGILSSYLIEFYFTHLFRFSSSQIYCKMNLFEIMIWTVVLLMLHWWENKITKYESAPLL